MHFRSILPAIPLLFGSGAAQFTGQRLLSFNATATGLDISDLGGSNVVSYAYSTALRLKSFQLYLVISYSYRLALDWQH